MTDPSSPNPASWPPPPSDPTPVPSAPLTPQAPAAPYPPAYPASAPYPASAAPYPASAAPYSAAPYGFAPPPAPKKNAWVIVLSILSGVLFLAGGGVGALYYLDHDKATKAAAEQRTQVDDLRGQLDQAQADLDGLEEDYADLEAEAERCTDAVGELLNATPAEGATEEELARQISALVFDLIQACDVSVNAP